MNRIKGILYAAVSSATFGLAPFFSISLLAIGYSSFEVLTYRWGVATVVLLVFAFLTKCDFHIGYKDFKTIFGLSLLRALTSFSLVKLIRILQVVLLLSSILCIRWLLQ